MMRSLPIDLRHKAEEIAGKLKDVSPKDVLLMVLGAGFDALEDALNTAGKVQMPLRFCTHASDSHDLRAKSFVPPAQVGKVQELVKGTGWSFNFIAQIALAEGLNHLSTDKIVHPPHSEDNEIPLFGAAYFKVIDGGFKDTEADLLESSGFRAQYVGEKGTAYRKVEVTMRIPVSELKEFQAYATHSRNRINFEESILVGSPSPGDCRWKYDLTTRVSIYPSKRGIIKRIGQLLRKEAITEISFELSENSWRQAKARAAHYGISLHTHCLSCLGYHASVWRADQKEKARKEAAVFPRFGTPNARLA